MKLFPDQTAVAVSVASIYRQSKELSAVERASSKMTKCAAHLPQGEFIGWQMRLAPSGMIKLELFGSQSVKASDLSWFFEALGPTKAIAKPERMTADPFEVLYELTIPTTRARRAGTIGFLSESGSRAGAETQWPMRYFSQYRELVQALRKEGAMLRYVVGPAPEDEAETCRSQTLAGWNQSSGSAPHYIGQPVRAKILLLLHDAPSLQLRTVLDDDLSGVDVEEIGRTADCRNVLERPLDSAATMPNVAARILMMEPVIYDEYIIGMDLIEKPLKPIPAIHHNTASRGAIEIGTALGSNGLNRKITIGKTDLQRHWHIVGQTGTGKSTLLANTILSAIQAGYGLTFFDPHGSTIDVVLRALPEQYAKKVHVVRIGDEENPVPINMWGSSDPEKEEKTINDLCQLFQEIFDPNHKGIVGPRWERWFTTFAMASIALLGRRASFESIITLSQSQGNMRKLYDRIKDQYPSLANTIKEEYGQSRSSEFTDLINWFVCKLDRITAVPQLRNTLGAGGNALNWDKALNSDTVTLIDLATPTLGQHASRVVGTLLLMQIWNAIQRRKDRNRMHLVVMDEAHLFQTNPLPQMLAEGRKFGLSLVLAHQHCRQLSTEVLEALEANSANFSAFRLSVRDSASASIRLDNADFARSLCHLNAFNAITSLSVDGIQSTPFTLQIPKTRQRRNGNKTAQAIEKRSRQLLVDPYRNCRALTSAEILNYLNEPEQYPEFADLDIAELDDEMFVGIDEMDLAI